MKTNTEVSGLWLRRGALVPRLLGALVLIAGLLWGVRTALHAWHNVETEDAYVIGHLHQVSSQIGGQLTEVLVTDNQMVAKGDLIARVDDKPLRIAVEHAQAAVEQAKAVLDQSRSAERSSATAVEQARARETQAAAQGRALDAQVELAQSSHRRSLQLQSGSGAITQADVDSTQASLNANTASREAAAANLQAAGLARQAAESDHDHAVQEIHHAEAGLDLALANLRDSQRLLSYAQITAPVAGRVGNRRMETGNMIVAGQALVSLAEPEMWIIANFKETQITRMSPGQEAELEIDALPGEHLRGHIDSISPASGAQFALLPPDNATGNFNKVVQRVPVKITFDKADLERLGDRLRLGLSVVVTVRIR